MNIQSVNVRDARFQLAPGQGSDAVHSTPQYSFAVTLLTLDSGLQGTGIVYTATIKNALEVQEHLTQVLGIPAAVYHSKLHKEERTAVQNAFMGETIRAVVATNDGRFRRGIGDLWPSRAEGWRVAETAFERPPSS